MTKDTQAIDTNILLRLILNDIPAQRRRAYRHVLNGATYYIPTLAITEAVFTLERGHYRFPRPAVVEALTTLIGSSCFSYDRPLLREVFPFYLAHPALSFNDCLMSFDVARRGYEPLWTFDKAFATQSPVAKEL